MSLYYEDTISSVTTAPGRAGVGIVRISGPLVPEIAHRIVQEPLKYRYAHYCHFHDELDNKLDEGLAILFKAPHSFTGEDVLELQGHGGPVILDMLLQTTVKLGCRLALPGEFSQRAFLNDKMDLTQAEAIADLIDSSSEQAARSALRTLQGDFSKDINAVLSDLISLRMYVEAAIDFPEEEVDFLADEKVKISLDQLTRQVSSVQSKASQGTLMTEGINVVIAGKPNAGKSSLLNAFAGKDSAIVTEIAGTTRDIVKERIHIDGMPLHIVDTAGLRESSDIVEQIGVDRAWQEITKADHILMLVDGADPMLERIDELMPEFENRLPSTDHITIIKNKIDLLSESATINDDGRFTVVSISAKTGDGITLLKEHIKKSVGYHAESDGSYTARRRHLTALRETEEAIERGRYQLLAMNAGELLAEELRIAQESLGKITGKYTPDDLLGEIFSSFCIGK